MQNVEGLDIARLVEEARLEIEGKKICSRCKQIKSLEEFYKRANRKAGRHSRCIECSLEISSNYYRETRDRRIQLRRTYTLKVYGLTTEEYDELLEEQGFVCAICGNQETNRTSLQKPNPLSVDHDHESGRVRGLLCSQCNQGIGKFRHSIDLLKTAIEYLEKR